MRNSGLGLILLGLLLALLGFASVVLFVLALSHLYVAAHLPALAELVGFLATGGAFLASYGAYLTRLEQWAPVDQTAQPEPPAHPTAEPAPTSVVVAIVTAAYGLLIACVGLFVMDARALVFNLLAGGSLVLCAAAVWWLGREKR